MGASEVLLLLVLLLFKTEGLDLEKARIAADKLASSAQCSSVVKVHGQVLDGAEVCAGVGMLSQVVKLHGFNAPALDITYWERYVHRRPTNSNPLDLLGDAGFASLSLFVQELPSFPQTYLTLKRGPHTCLRLF